jgi:HPt (histidine-containing phosphotransfer) domain-containing protein
MRTALDQGDADELGRLAHNLKGIALNFSAEAVAGVAAELEELGRLEDLSRAPAKVATLEVEIQRLTEFAAAHLG